MSEFIAYYRVSTEQQGQSRLGLEAQRKAVFDYIESKGSLVSEFHEVETGKRSDRPELAKALMSAKKNKAILVIAKLDRLARNVAFVSGLMESGVEFVAADMPNADRFMLHVYSAMAEEEARRISERTKAALAARKARGLPCGWAMPERSNEAKQAAGKRSQVLKTKADSFAANIQPIVKEIQKAGVTSLSGIATALNARGIKTARAGQWYAATVKNVLSREPV